MLVESFNRTRWLDKLRPAGGSQKADGPEGPMAPIVTAGVSVEGKKTFLTCHPCAGSHLNHSVSFHGRSLNCACHPCARAMPVFTVLKKKGAILIFKPILHFSNYACQPCTGAMQILFKSLTRHPSRGHAALLLEKKSMYVSSLHEVPCKFSLRNSRNVQLIPCRRESRHSFAVSP